MTRQPRNEEIALGLDTGITRRDFVGGTLIGTGVALLGMHAPFMVRSACAAPNPQLVGAQLTGLDPEWTGPGGVGDYARSNGNTHVEVNAAHALRNGDFNRQLESASDTGEVYDLVVVGCGFAGLGAGYTFKKARPNGSALLLDNHSIFGGEARQNEFEVDGYHLWAPQGSNGCPWPKWQATAMGLNFKFYDELGLPNDWEFQELEGTNKKLKVPGDVYGPMHMSWERADMGWFFNDKGWSINPWANGFKDTPIPDSLKREYLVMELWRDHEQRLDFHEYLDSMTYLDFITKIMKLSPDITELLNPFLACMGTGLGADVISAAQAYNFFGPGVVSYKRVHEWGDPTDQAQLISFPGGNTGIARHFVKHVIPDAIPGDRSRLSDVLFNKIDWNALDRANNSIRMRLGATVVNVEHEGKPESAKYVRVIYYMNGKLYRVRARGVVMASGQWINRSVVSDLPEAHKEAMGEFHHAPILTVNVALRNWKFMERLGITAARWFGGFGWYTSVRRQLKIDGSAPMPLDPAKPTVLTFYIPFLNPGLPLAEQAATSRMQLFGMSFRQIEMAIREQLTKMFSSYGFDAKRDIAGIVANRQGHAYVVTPPGFYYGKNGQPPPSDVIRMRHGRIAFGHSELQGAQLWMGAAEEGERAVQQILEVG